MAISQIEWTQLVWNTTTGCDKVSQGCKNCYAEKMHKRLQVMQPVKYHHPFLGGVHTFEPALAMPFRWKKGRNIFVNSMSDLFHEDVPMEYIAKVYAVMFLTPQHTYQVLTKRPERRREILYSRTFMELLWSYCNTLHDQHINKLEQELYFFDEVNGEVPLRNVWEGVSVEDQGTANERIPILRETPSFVRWISAEPLLGPVDLIEADAFCLDWVVVGGESGPKKRPFDIQWAQDILDFCQVVETKFFMKQIDKVQPIPPHLMVREYPEKIKRLNYSE
jgi:protein gp37